MTIATSITSDWIEIATINVTAATGFTENGQIYICPSNNRDTSGGMMKFRVSDTKIYAFFGIAGYTYQPNLIFFCN